MCVTDVYTDRYPDGREVDFRQTTFCSLGQPGRPCNKHYINSNPVRAITYHELTTQQMLSHGQTHFPLTPLRSSGGAHAHTPGEYASSEDSRRRRRRHPTLKPTRTHRRERIVIVDSPPTPRTPPRVYTPVFTTPSPPILPPRITDERRSRPVIVDERPLHPPRRSLSAARVWESPSNSHTTFDLRGERERAGERRREALRKEERVAERAHAERMLAIDEEIRRRPAVPAPLRRGAYLRPVVDQTEALMAGLRLGGRDAGAEWRRAETERLARRRLEIEEEEALKARLRERQLSRRRFSVGPGRGPHGVLYDDGVYR